METDHEHSWRRVAPNVWACRICLDVATDARVADETGLPTSGSMGSPPRLARDELERAGVRRRIRVGQDYARRHGTKSGRPIGRPPLDTDVTKICDALRGRVHERGAIAEVAARFNVSRGWIYKRVLPALSSD